MPKTIELRQNLPALMCRNVYEIQMISWVASRQVLNTNFKITAAVKDFLRYYNVPEELWSEKTAISFAFKTLGDDRDMIFENLLNKINCYEHK